MERRQERHDRGWAEVRVNRARKEAGHPPVGTAGALEEEKENLLTPSKN